MPAIILNSSRATWGALPLPADAMLTLRGLALPHRRSVYPSAGARTTASVPILLPPPGRFSMMNGWPSALRQPLADQAGRDVGRAARGDWYDQTHRPRRVGLCPRDRDVANSATAPAARCRDLRRGSFI